MKYDSEIAELSRRVDFSGLDGKSILITGGSGFVGNWLIQGLYAATIYHP
jgi:NADPH:quinone reductase-like Zn-dependent oxidoreductase